MIATNLPLFQTINALPIVLDPSRLDDGGGRRHTERKQGKVSPELLTDVQQHQARTREKKSIQHL